jgi:hypothetical protein
MKKTIVAWFRREDYDAIKALVGDDPDFPATFDEWLERTQQQVAKLETRSTVVEKAVINPDDFATYCRSSGIEQGINRLNAFAIVQNRRDRETGTARS